MEEAADLSPVQCGFESHYRHMDYDEIERLMSEDPDDRLIREAHGFTYEDNWQDESLMCRNGCGVSYYEIAIGKMRQCRER